MIYNNGPWQAGVAFEKNNKVRFANTNDTEITATGGWNFGIARVALVYEYLKYEMPDSVGGGDVKRNFWGVSGTMPMGPRVVRVLAKTDGTGSACDINTTGCNSRVGGLARGDSTSSQQYEISYTYPFSKRTQVYAGYVKIQNENQALYTFNINAYPIAPGGKPQGFVMGMIHLF